MKTVFKIAAATLAAGAVIPLAGCGGCAGCNAKTSNNALTSSNWYTGTSYKGIQPSFIFGDNEDYTKEVVEYDVTHDNTAATNATYSVEYTNGKFVTEFYAFRYDWNTNREYPEDKTEILYRYETELTISVSFTLKSTGEKTNEPLNDRVKTVAYFRAAGKNLQPVYSRQEILSHSPAAYQASSIDNIYKKVDAVYENFYNYDCTAVTSINGDDKDVHDGLDKIGYSVFDNSSLYIAVRSMKLSSKLAQTVYLYSPAQGSVTSYVLAGTDTPIDASEEKTELKHITAEMQKHDLFVPAENRETVPAVAINVMYAGGTLHGTTQTVWYAAIENADNNTGRATMLKLATPLSYGLGTLNYSLKEIKSTLWNK